MKLNELLKENGITDDVAAKVFKAMKENNIYTTSEENLDIRFGKLKTDHEGTTKQLNEANALIDQLKKSNKGNEGLQSKIAEYEGEIKTLQEQLNQTKLEAAVKVALLSEKALDVDYLTFKLKEKGELKLDENEKIEGWNDKLSGLKTQFPNQFEGVGNKRIQEHKLEGGDNESALTKQILLKKPYAERMKIYEENPEAYEAAMKS